MPRPSRPRRCHLAVALPLAIAAAVAGTTAPPLAAQAAPDPPRLGAGPVASQLALGVVGTAGGFVVGGLATRWTATRLGAAPDRASSLAMVGAWTGAALATPVGPMLVGRRDGARGSYPAAVAGTLAGGAASLLVVTAGRRGAFDCRACAPLRLLAGVSAVVLPSLGATLAFNASREAR